jgi:hypothetical protein
LLELDVPKVLKKEKSKEEEHKELVGNYFAAFKSFREIVHGTFGNNLCDNWPERIDDFKRKFLVLEISATTKVMK